MIFALIREGYENFRTFGNAGKVFALAAYFAITQEERISFFIFTKHYENTPIQIYRILPPKTEHFQIKISHILHISAQNIDCGYSLEPPRRGGSNEYPQSIFF